MSGKRNKKKIDGGGVKKIFWHEIVLVSVLLILSGWRLWQGRWVIEVDVLKWWLGAILGFLFVFLDRLAAMAVAEPEKVLEIKLKEVGGKGKMKKGLMSLLTDRGKEDKLIMRTALFLVVWVVLALLSATSVASFGARGFVLGIGTHLVFDLIWDYFKDKERLSRWFWQSKGNFSEKEMEVFFWLIVAAYVLIGWRL